VERPTNPVTPARRAGDLEQVRVLLREYADGLGVDLAYQGFEAELAGLPGKYAPPPGALLLARAKGGEATGCVAVRPLDIPGACEIKRLYVRDSARGTATGRALAMAAVAFAAEAGYDRVLLDTLPFMMATIALYRALGFEPVPGYWDSIVPGTLYFGKRLRLD
jgi:putative acetyltransferase